MSDDPSKRGKQDRHRINVSEDYELRYWTEKFGVSQDERKSAVQKLGPMATNVQQHLGVGRMHRAKRLVVTRGARGDASPRLMPGLQQPAFRERHAGGAAYDEMVENLHVDQPMCARVSGSAPRARGSARLGSAIPEGWLCAKMIAAAFKRSASFTISPGKTLVWAGVPRNRCSTDKTRFWASTRIATKTSWGIPARRCLRKSLTACGLLRASPRARFSMIARAASSRAACSFMSGVAYALEPCAQNRSPCSCGSVCMRLNREPPACLNSFSAGRRLPIRAVRSSRSDA
jgi:hypothetical protein